MFRRASLTGKPHRSTFRTVAAALALISLAGLTGVAEAKKYRSNKLEGTVEGNGAPLPHYKVTLYASYAAGIPYRRILGTDTTDGAGKFEIKYKLPPGLSYHKQPVLYVLAEDGKKMVASTVGKVSKYDEVVVNELTTVAIGTAFAQFIHGRNISGNKVGVQNAVKMAANMADPKTGAIGNVLDQGPNGDDTSTRATFYSMANIVASCIANAANCTQMFEDATPKNGGTQPTTVLQAVANMTKFPSTVTITGFDSLFALSLLNTTYPGLPIGDKPASWLLFIKFTGEIGPGAGDYKATNLMSGPGQINFDHRGFAWINDNYNPADFDPDDPADLIPPDDPKRRQIGCAGARLMQFYSSGAPVPNTPYFGGGLSGAGYGIAIDPRRKIWVGNFGFESPLCDDLDPPFDPPFGPVQKIPATHDSLSLFRPNGNPISGSDGFTRGDIWWPQGMASDKKGNIWIGNCGNDTVTFLPRGNPRKARNFRLPGGLAEETGITQPPLTKLKFGEPRPRLKPFGVTVDPKGRAWVAANAVGYGKFADPAGFFGGVYRVSKDGNIRTIISHDDDLDLLSFPMGIAGDSKGNIWVSNSDAVFVPCVTPFTTDQGKVNGPFITFIPADSTDATGARKFATMDLPNTGGLTIPWGNVVDGNDTLWVFNFGTIPFDIDGDPPFVGADTPLSHFCGADTDKCPPGKNTGDALSPPEGYLTDALDRVTGGGVDPSGNLWILNNWKKSGPFNVVFIRNPGGNSFVIVPGAAGPVKTPVFGPPESFDREQRHLAVLSLFFFFFFFFGAFV